MTKQKFKKILEQNKLYFAGTTYGRSGWTRFNAFYMSNNKLVPLWVEESLYWDKKHNCYNCLSIGSNRLVIILLDIGEKLGLEFTEIKQNYHFLSEES